MRPKRSSPPYLLLPLALLLPVAGVLVWLGLRYGEMALDLVSAAVKLGVLP